jgi:pilus assembly protein CpaF
MSDEESNVPLSLAESIRRKVAEARKEKATNDEALPPESHSEQPSTPLPFSELKASEGETYASQFKRKLEEARAKTRDMEVISGPIIPHGALIREREKAVLHKLRAELDMSKLANIKDHVYKQVQERIRELIAEDHAPLNSQEKSILFQNVCDEVFGFGPLSVLLRDPTVNGIYVNGTREVFVDRDGQLERVPVAFENNDHIMQVVEKITQGNAIDSTYPMGTLQLPNGSRAEIIISPVSVDGPIIAIRCYGTSIPSVGQLAAKGFLTEPMAELLRLYVQANINIVLCGTFGSGRSTLLNALSQHIQINQRIVSIEDSPGLRMQHSNWVRLRTDFSADNKDMGVNKRKIVAQAMRMRPDRIILSDCAGDEGYEFLQGLNGGRCGDMVTMVAGSIKDCLRRFETMVRWGDTHIPPASARELVADAMQVIVHMKRLPSGQRVIDEIAEVHGLNHGEFDIRTLYKYERDFDENGATTYNHRATEETSTYVDMTSYESRRASRGAAFRSTASHAPKGPLSNLATSNPLNDSNGSQQMLPEVGAELKAQPEAPHESHSEMAHEAVHQAPHEALSEAPHKAQSEAKLDDSGLSINERVFDKVVIEDELLLDRSKLYLFAQTPGPVVSETVGTGTANQETALSATVDSGTATSEPTTSETLTSTESADLENDAH